MTIAELHQTLKRIQNTRDFGQNYDDQIRYLWQDALTAIASSSCIGASPEVFAAVALRAVDA